jgi:Holliday junction resolvasome RuvABC endonuclease subunit
MAMSSIMGIDAGFTHTGIVVVEDNKVVHHETVRTKKDSHKKAVRVADDDAERCRVLTAALQKVIQEYEPAAAFVELPSGGAQGARANRTMGMAAAFVVAVLEVFQVPAEWVTPGMVKKAAAGRKDASKQDVQDAVKETFDWSEHPLGGYKWQVEHAADAAGALLAGRGGQLWKALQRIGA